MGLLQRFLGDRRASVVPMFAISIIPLTALVGAAVDYSRAGAARTAVQASLDTTALILSKQAPALLKSDPSGASLTTVAKAYFGTVFNRTDVNGLTVSATYTNTPGNTPDSGPKLVVSADGTIGTVFLGVLGQLGGADFTTLPVSASATAVWNNTRLRVALVLDNTGSMASSGKIAALKTAATNLVDQIKAASSVDGDVYVSIIPFAKDVNAGPANYAADWIDWTAWEAPPDNSMPSASVGPGSSCPYSTSNQGYGCTTGPATGSPSTGTVPSGGTYKGYICPSVDNGRLSSPRNGNYYNGCWTSTYKGKATCTGSSCSCSGRLNCSCTGSYSSTKCTYDEYDHRWLVNDHNTWTGCVWDRDQNNDTTNTPPTSGAKFPAQQYSSCTTAVTPLTYDWDTLKARIQAMGTNGSTNQTIGLVWGWQSLAQTAPLNAPALDPTYQYRHYVILLSDGLNTQNRWSGNGSATSTEVDARMRAACGNIQVANPAIELFTVQVNTGGDPTSTLLRDCATNTKNTYDHFFELKKADDIVTTFDTIGNKITKLHLAF